MQVGQHQKQIQAGEQHRHGGPEKEPVDLRRRVVHRGEEAARHGGEDDGAAAVGPAQQNPQHRGDDDCAHGGKRRVEHQPTVEERRESAQAPVAVDSAPGVLAFALDGGLQAAAVLPQVDPFAQAVQRVGEQQRMTVIQRFALGLRGVDLVAQQAPAFQWRGFGGALQPGAGFFQQRRELIEKLRRTVLNGVHRIVQSVDHWQQVNHAPAQFLGVAYRLRACAFVGQLADHQFKGVEGGDHAAAQVADFLRVDLAAEKALAIDLRVAEPLGHRAIEHRHQPPRPEHRAHHRCDCDAEEDFFGTRLRHIPDRQGVIHHRQGNQRQGVAGQHQGVVIRGAQVHGQEQQGAGPQRNHHHQNVG